MEGIAPLKKLRRAFDSYLLSTMSQRRFPPPNFKAEAVRSSLENDRPPTITDISNVTTSYLNVMTAPSHSLSHPDFAGHRDENKSSLTDTIGIAEKSKVLATPNYSKLLSGF